MNVNKTPRLNQDEEDQLGKIKAEIKVSDAFVINFQLKNLKELDFPRQFKKYGLKPTTPIEDMIAYDPSFKM